MMGKILNQIILVPILLYLCPVVADPLDYPYNDYKDKMCKEKIWKKVRCVQTKTLFWREDMLVDWRHDIEWESSRIPTFAHSFVCACAEAAKEAGVRYFGTHFWGECFGLMDHKISSEEGDCRLANGNYQHPTYCHENYEDIKDFECLAIENYYLYEVVEAGEAVNGNWTSWTRWSPCTSGCDHRTRSKTRTCTSPNWLGNGREGCTGKSTLVEDCIKLPCMDPPTEPRTMAYHPTFPTSTTSWETTHPQYTAPPGSTPPPPPPPQESSTSNIDGGSWTLVRHVPAGDMWHKASDQLAGIDEYGTPCGTMCSEEWSIKYDDEKFNQFLFATGDESKWLIADKNNVAGSFFSHTPRVTYKASGNTNSFKTGWYRQNETMQHAWVSQNGNQSPNMDGDILYAENHFMISNGENILMDHNGANVFIRMHV